MQRKLVNVLYLKWFHSCHHCVAFIHPPNTSHVFIKDQMSQHLYSLVVSCWVLTPGDPLQSRWLEHCQRGACRIIKRDDFSRVGLSWKRRLIYNYLIIIIIYVHLLWMCMKWSLCDRFLVRLFCENSLNASSSHALTPFCLLVILGFTSTQPMPARVYTAE